MYSFKKIYGPDIFGNVTAILAQGEMSKALGIPRW